MSLKALRTCLTCAHDTRFDGHRRTGSDRLKRAFSSWRSFRPRAVPVQKMRYMASAIGEDYRLTVITLLAEPPLARELQEFSLRLNSSDRFTVRRGFSFHPHRGGLVWRAMREQFMAWRLAFLSRSESPVIIVTSSPSMFPGPAARGLAQHKGAAFVGTYGTPLGSTLRQPDQARHAKRYLASGLKRWISHSPVC